VLGTPSTMLLSVLVMRLSNGSQLLVFWPLAGDEVHGTWFRWGALPLAWYICAGHLGLPSEAFKLLGMRSMGRGSARGRSPWCGSSALGI
jgi:hypothetical protein